MSVGDQWHGMKMTLDTPSSYSHTSSASSTGACSSHHHYWTRGGRGGLPLGGRSCASTDATDSCLELTHTARASNYSAEKHLR